MKSRALLENCELYDEAKIYLILLEWKALFKTVIHSNDIVVIKPNWIAPSHKYDENEWQSVITHPAVITSVLKIVLAQLNGKGKVIIADGPQTDSSWEKIMQIMQPQRWIMMGEKAGVEVQVLDLREDEWVSKGDVIVSRKKLSGDPLGSVECDLKNVSEFVKHQSSPKGYYGADYNKSETNEAHSNGSHRYRVARSVMEADVFINLPKLKTHKKAGITCSLKNLVGINTYKNFLPHHNEGTPEAGGDQFPTSNVKNKVEATLIEKFKAHLYHNPSLTKLAIPIKKAGTRVFGDTQHTIRSGNWYGNDTLWRTVLDLNKILFYANPDGSFRKDRPGNKKKYITIVDGIVAGEGNGPEAPTPKQTGVLIGGINPVAVDAVCAKLMGFDWRKIPIIRHAFQIKQYPFCDFCYKEIEVISSSLHYNKMLEQIDPSNCFRFEPHFGWKNHIEI